MPGRITAVDGRFVRLSDAMRARVEHLAKAAHVTTSDVVNYVLAEVLEGDDPPQREVESPRPDPPRRRSRGPADVIPIMRNRVRVPAGPVEPHLSDLGYRRLQAKLRWITSARVTPPSDPRGRRTSSRTRPRGG